MKKRALRNLGWCAAWVLMMSACATTKLATMGNNPGVASESGEPINGSSCIFAFAGYRFGSATMEAAVNKALEEGNKRDKRASGTEYNALVDADLKFTKGPFSLCFEVTGKPARLGAP